MAALRTVDLLVLSIVVLCTTCSALKLDFAELLKNSKGRGRNELSQKRAFDEGNPCDRPEKPFPCKTRNKCIPMAYVCDDNFDCDDGYDEDPEVCTAFNRPPVEDLLAFLRSEKSWIMPNLFGNKSPEKVAHALAVSQTVDGFRRRVGLPGSFVGKIRRALDAVAKNEEDVFERMFDMPPNAWDGVNDIFSRLLKSGFA